MTAGALAALAHLTGALLRRMLRESLVIRSLAFPVALTAGTLVMTLMVVAYVRARPVIALTEPLAVPELAARLTEAGFRSQVFVRTDSIAPPFRPMPQPHRLNEGLMGLSDASLPMEQKAQSTGGAKM